MIAEMPDNLKVCGNRSIKASSDRLETHSRELAFTFSSSPISEFYQVVRIIRREGQKSPRSTHDDSQRSLREDFRIFRKTFRRSSSRQIGCRFEKRHLLAEMTFKSIMINSISLPSRCRLNFTVRLSDKRGSQLPGQRLFRRWFVLPQR